MSRPVALRVGPLPGGAPAVEMVFEDGSKATATLDVSQAHLLILRLRECLDGRIVARPPSRRVLELVLGFVEEMPSSVAAIPAVVPDLDLDLREQVAE